MRGIGSVWVGLFFLVIATALFIGGNQVLLYFVDNPFTQREITLADNVGINETVYSLTFNFSKDVIYSNYDISNGERLYTSFLNIYSDELLDNTTLDYITMVKINNNVYTPINISYEYSLQIEDETLDKDIQTLEITKSSGLLINKITLSYRGIEYSNYEYYSFAIFVFTVIVFFLGIGILHSSSKN